jgi:cyclophilin family peptidyl-prolyl cis-trans isomerase
MRIHCSILILAAALAASCGRETVKLPTVITAPAAPPPSMQANAQPRTPPAYQPKREPEFHFADLTKVPDSDLGRYHVTMKVAVEGQEVGTMVFALWPEKAPVAVRNFLRYCDEGFYDGLLFHRIARDFMIQGGSALNNGAGTGPNGIIPAEFSLDPRWNHRYGVLSMARLGHDPNSASSQFFLCCGESLSTAGLNGKYSSFGRMVAGVTALEALANVPVEALPNGEVSDPVLDAAMVAVRVVKAPAPASAEIIARPSEENPAPQTIVVQHILISFSGTRTAATRSKEEAEALANDVFSRVKKGEDFVALLKEFSDDNFDPNDPNPSVYKMHSLDFALPGGFEAYEKLQGRWFESLQAKEAEYRAGTIDAQAFLAALETLERADLQKSLGAFVRPPAGFMPRNKLVPAFGDVGFALKVGEIGMAAYDKKTSSFGWHIIRRTE